jgi:histidinol-phosphate aminotransferase
MTDNRRNWLKKIGILIAGAGFMPGMVTASPVYDPTPETDGVKEDAVILSSNENPYGPSQKARKAMAGAVNISNRYQWQMIRDLMTAIAIKNGMSSENVLIGAGSIQLLDAIAQYASHKPGNVIVADPTFSRWADIAERSGLQKIAVPLTKDKKHDLPAMASKINSDTRLVYICNPNNPTGTICNREDLNTFIKGIAGDTLVLIDEAYLDYTNEASLADMVKDNEHVVVVKTFSKIYGMAGARVGYVLGHAKTIEKISDLQMGANMGISAVSLAGAIAALNDNDFVKSTSMQNEDAKRYTIEQLNKLGLTSIPSHTNFIYFSLENYNKDFFKQIKEHNIQGTEIFEENGKWTRITVGTMEEMKKFISAIG